jgi:methionyl-tRNA synthetase
LVSFEEWQNIEIRIGKIVSVEEIPGKDKLYKLSVSFGETQKQVIAGIKPYYAKEEVEGKKVAFVFNLEPVKIAGFESEAMILGALNEENKYKLLFADESISEGKILE